MNNYYDEVDEEIINLLKKNGRLPNTEIAKKLNVSEAAIRKRLKRLIDEEIIQVVAVINHRKFGYEIEGNVRIKADIKKAEKVAQALKPIKNLWYVAHLTGAADFDVEFSVRSQDDLRKLVKKINEMDGVLSTETSIRLQLIKNRYDLETPKA